MSEATPSVRFHQLLHGYDRGHRRLGGSIDLPQEAGALVDLLSDLSGGTVVPGFDSYLTVYPVDRTDLVAVARTWLAPEMPRPGCVWTHTLLVSRTELSMIDDLSAIDSLFRRPDGPDFSAYQAPIEPVRLTRSRGRHPPRKLARHVLWSLYWHPDNRLRIAADSAREYEPLLWDIWSQQWPTLRRAFRFCSGSIEDRNASPHIPTFDLQVMPRRAARMGLRNSPDVMVVDDDAVDAWSRLSGMRLGEESLGSAWLTLAHDDLSEARRTGLREWLATFGSDAKKPRAAFAPLVDLFGTATSPYRRDRSATAELLQSISRWYPAPQQARRLKKALFSADPWNAHIVRLPERELIPELAVSPLASVLDPDDLEIETRAQALAQTGQLAISPLIKGGAQTRVGRAVATGLFLGAPISQLVRFLRDSPGYLSEVIDCRSELISEPSVWKAAPDAIPDLTARVLVEDLDSPNLGVLCRVCLETDNVASAVMLSEVSALARSVLFDTIDTVPNLGDDGALQTFFASHTDEVANWIATHHGRPTGTPMYAAKTLAPDAPALKPLPADVWLPLASQIARMKEAEERGRILSFLYASSLLAPRSDGAELARIAFPPLWETSRNDKINHQSWRMIAKASSDLRAPFPSRENSEYLIMTVAWAIAKKSWPPILIVELFPKAKHLKDALELLDDDFHASKAVDSLRMSVHRNPRLCSTEQRAIIEKTRSKKWLSRWLGTN